MATPVHPHLDVTARCACGRANLHVAGRILSMFYCACEDCQRATGTGHSSVVMVRRSDLEVGGGISSFTRPAASGATMTRHFCGDCGTPLYAQSSRATSLAMLPAGLLGGAGWFAPNQIIFARSLRDWDVLPAELPRYQTYRENEVSP